MNRRELILLLGGAMAVSRALHAQQKAMPVIGFLGISSPDASRVAAFRLGLGDTGWIDGQNVAIEYRWAEDRRDRLAALAADFVGRKVDVLMTQGAPSAAINATTTIPIVFIYGGDPVQDRLVSSCIS